MMSRPALRRALVAALALLLLPGAGASAQMIQVGPPVDRPVSASTRSAVVRGIVDALRGDYVFPDIGTTMAASLEAGLAADRWRGLDSSIAFAESLTAQLQTISRDKHLRVVYREEAIPERAEAGEPTPAERERFVRDMAARNFGFERVERLPGNIGYMDLRGFNDPGAGADEVAVAAMNFLANCDALIVDLRKNGGGHPEMVALLSTYLFPEGARVHLNDLYFRPADETTQFWTLPSVPGKRLAGKDVYILTSKYTFSAAEEFTYNLKNLERATIVGETTGGGAHPGGMVRLGDHFAMFCPTGRAINPISRTNWEGTGVAPDLACSAEEALSLARVTALERLLAKAQDARDRERLNMALELTKAEAAGAVPAGADGPVRIVVRD
jgi:hypothetical protein